MEQRFLAFFSISLSAGCLALRFCLLRPMLVRHYPTRVRRPVWLILAVRLALPLPLPPSAQKPVVQPELPATAAQPLEPLFYTDSTTVENPVENPPMPVENPVESVENLGKPPLKSPGFHKICPLSLFACLSLAGSVFLLGTQLLHCGPYRRCLSRWNRPAAPRSSGACPQSFGTIVWVSPDRRAPASRRSSFQRASRALRSPVTPAPRTDAHPPGRSLDKSTTAVGMRPALVEPCRPASMPLFRPEHCVRPWQNRAEWRECEAALSDSALNAAARL